MSLRSFYKGHGSKLFEIWWKSFITTLRKALFCFVLFFFEKQNLFGLSSVMILSVISLSPVVHQKWSTSIWKQHSQLNPSRFRMEHRLAYLAVTQWSWVQITRGTKNIFFEKHFEELVLGWNMKNVSEIPYKTQTWPAETKISLGLEYIQKESFQSQKVRCHAL